MAALTDFLVQFGGFGMFLSALLAGSIIPFSSELVMTALKLAGVSNLSLLLWGTVGNVLGSSMNYGLGRLGKLEWLEKHAHISKEKMTKAVMEKNVIARSRQMLPGDPILCLTRYGNVMGSRGSVIPLFCEQIDEGKQLTITNTFAASSSSSMDG